MKKMKLITNLILPAIAIGAVAAPIMLTTACTKNFVVGPFLNNEEGHARVSAVCKWSGNSKESTTFEVGSSHTFVFTTVGTAAGRAVTLIPLFLECLIPDNPEAQSNPDDYFIKEPTSNTLTIKIIKSIHSKVSIKSKDGDMQDSGQIQNDAGIDLYSYLSYISFDVA